MKTNKLLLFAAILAASPILAPAAERVVDASELPAPVKETLADSGRGDRIGKITVRHAGGRLVYDVELLRQNAPGEHLRIGDDGKILADTRKAAGSTTTTTTTPPPVAPLGYPAAYPGGYGYEPYVVPTPPSLRLEDLPQAAQATIRREAADRPIATIQETAVDKRKAYVAQFRESGRNPQVYVAEDGSVLRPTEKPPVLLIGTTFSDTPAPVQQALRRELGDGEIVSIDKDRGSRGEADSYQVEAKDAHGSYRLRLSADGRVLENTRRASR